MSATRARIVVIGTGTGIGKTHAGVALVAALARAGVSVAGLKPIESGVSPETFDATDAAALAAVGTFHVKHPPYALAEPVSPHLAARRSGITIDLDVVAAWVDSHAADVVVVETAGALLSPLSSRSTNLDLTCALRPTHLVLVAPDRLGVLHDVTATKHALRTLAPTLPSPTLLLQPTSTPDASTGTNADELATLGLGKAHVFQHAAPTAKENITVASKVLSELGLASA